jgi:hypothetical protein
MLRDFIIENYIIIRSDYFKRKNFQMLKVSIYAGKNIINY